MTLWTSNEQTVNTCVIVSASLRLPRPHLLSGRYLCGLPFHEVDAMGGLMNAYISNGFERDEISTWAVPKHLDLELCHR